MFSVSNNAEMTRLGWLHAAQVVKDALDMRPAMFFADGIRMRRDFVSRVRETNGVGMDEVYTWEKVRQLLGS